MSQYTPLLKPAVWVVDLTVASLRLMEYIYAKIVPLMPVGPSREDVHKSVERLAASVIAYSAANTIGAYLQKDPFDSPEKHMQIVLHHSALISADLPTLNVNTLHQISEELAIHSEMLVITAVSAVLPDFSNENRMKIHKFSVDISRTPSVMIEGDICLPPL